MSYTARSLKQTECVFFATGERGHYMSYEAKGHTHSVLTQYATVGKPIDLIEEKRIVDRSATLSDCGKMPQKSVDFLWITERAT